MLDVTVVVPTSPVPIHPSTAIIERVIASIKSQLPNAPILILCDGVRPELKHRESQYREYLARLGSLGFQPFIFAEHMQQSGMLMETLEFIKTPFLFFCEHDAIVDDKPINWDAIEKLLSLRIANTVRLYWHETIHPEHEHLMLERDGDFVKTKQWSSWPHISRLDFYKKIMEQHFGPGERMMTETRLYSPVLESPWEEYRTMIYAPQPDAIRFHHLDARRDPITGEKDFGDW